MVLLLLYHRLGGVGVHTATPVSTGVVFVPFQDLLSNWITAICRAAAGVVVNTTQQQHATARNETKVNCAPVIHFHAPAAPTPAAVLTMRVPLIVQSE
jgi:hypothetical protein